VTIGCYCSHDLVKITRRSSKTVSYVSVGSPCPSKRVAKIRRNECGYEFIRLPSGSVCQYVSSSNVVDS